MPLTDPFNTTPAVAKTPAAQFGAFNTAQPTAPIAPFLVRFATDDDLGDILAGNTYDGVVAQAGDRVLRYGSLDSTDGIVMVKAAGAAEYAPEADGETEVPAYVKVLEGTTKGGHVFQAAVDFPAVDYTDIGTPPTNRLAPEGTAAGAIANTVAAALGTFNTAAPTAIAPASALGAPGTMLLAKTVALTNFDLATLDPTTNGISGAECDVGDLFILAGQTDPVQNGIYLADGNVPAPRASVANSSAEIDAAIRVKVTGGTYAGAEYLVYPTARPFTLGTTAVTVRRDP